MEGVRFLNLEWVFYKIYQGLKFIFTFGDVEGGGRLFVTGSQKFFIFVAIVVLVTMAFLLYYSVRYYELKFIDKKRLDVALEPDVIEDEDVKNERWERIETLLISESEADWRIAIIEADSMLDELTVDMGLAGGSLGERLKDAQSAGFPRLQSAWNAHLMRNKIAHEGLGYHLTKREKSQAKAWYEEVFRAAGII